MPGLADRAGIPDEDYLIRIGTFVYLFALLESRVVEGISTVYSMNVIQGGFEDPLWDKLRKAVFSKNASGDRLRAALKDLMTDLHDNGHITEELYAKKAMDIMWASFSSGAASLVVRRNILLHSWSSSHIYEGPRLNRRYLVNREVDKTSDGLWNERNPDSHWAHFGPSDNGVTINDEWLNTFIKDLRSGLSDLHEMEKRIDISSLHGGVKTSLYDVLGGHLSGDSALEESHHICPSTTCHRDDCDYLK